MLRSRDRAPPPCTLWHRVLSAALLSVASAGCRHHDHAAALVIGIQSEAMGGVVSALHVVVKVAGDVVVDEKVKPQRGVMTGFPQPWEKSISGDGEGTAQVDVQVDAIGDPNAPSP